MSPRIGTLFPPPLARRSDRPPADPSAEIDEDFARTEWPERALAGLDVREQLFHRLWVDRHPQASGQNDMPPRALTALPPAPEFDALPLRTPGSRLGQTQGGEGGTPSARRRAGPSDSPTSPLFFALKERLFF